MSMEKWLFSTLSFLVVLALKLMKMCLIKWYLSYSRHQFFLLRFSLSHDINYCRQFFFRVHHQVGVDCWFLSHSSLFFLPLSLFRFQRSEKIWDCPQRECDKLEFKIFLFNFLKINFCEIQSSKVVACVWEFKGLKNSCNDFKKTLLSRVIFF